VGKAGAFDMRKLLPGSVALIALSLSIPALAADLEVEPAYKAARPVVRSYDWSGFYIGGNVGGHWGTDKVTTGTDVDFEGLGLAGGAAIDGISPATLNPRGFIGGVQAGYNLEGSGGVWGIEVDANWLGGTATHALTNIPVINPLDVMTHTVQATFLSTMRMRWGTTVFSDRSLFFLTAGFAFGTLKTTDSMGHNGNAPITSVSGSSTQPGLTAGGGFEFAFTDNLSAKVEYLYVNLRSFGTTIPGTGAFADSIVVNHDYSDHIGRFGLNFKFGGSPL
jgi:outer membrane immunogenic protein